MIKLNRFLAALIVVSIWLVVITIGIISTHNTTTIDSEWNCCSITIDRTDSVVIYTTMFEDNYTKTVIPYTNEEELQEALNTCDDICYYEHN